MTKAKKYGIICFIGENKKKGTEVEGGCLKINSTTVS